MAKRKGSPSLPTSQTEQTKTSPEQEEVGVLSGVRQQVDIMLNHLAARNLNAADAAYADIKETLSVTEVIAPGDLQKRRVELLEACVRGERFLIKRKGRAMALLGPPELDTGAEEVSPSLFDGQRGEILERACNGKVFLISRRGRPLALLGPPLQLNI